MSPEFRQAVEELHTKCELLLLALGNTIKEMLEAKLHWQFPNRPCAVEFYIPEDEDDFGEYQVFFCQSAQFMTGAQSGNGSKKRDFRETTLCEKKHRAEYAPPCFTA